MRNHSDSRLLALVVSGDASAFDVLYRRHSPAVARYAWTWCQDTDVMQEIVQETFITAWRKAGRIELPGDSLLPWLLVTARHHGANMRRKAARRREDRLDVALALSSDGSYEAAEQLRWVRDAIESLDPLDQKVCQLCLVEGLTYREAAERLDQTPAWVGKRLQRARAHIRKAEFSDD